jgi:hypothetical protein
MDFGFNGFDISNLNSNGFDAIHFSMIGMLIVFGGLTVIAIYITLLPRILNISSTLKKKLTSCRGKESGAADQGMDTETLIAVAAALHLYQFSSDDNRRITWKRHELWDSSWQRAGRFEAMNNQGSILAPRRQPDA